MQPLLEHKPDLRVLLHNIQYMAMQVEVWVVVAPVGVVEAVAQVVVVADQEEVEVVALQVVALWGVA